MQNQAMLTEIQRRWFYEICDEWVFKTSALISAVTNGIFP